MKTYIEQVLERAEAATEGPWSVGESRPHIILPSNNPDEYALAVCEKWRRTSREDYPIEANALFIAHARTDVPELALRLKKAIEALRYMDDTFGVIKVFIQELERGIE